MIATGAIYRLRYRGDWPDIRHAWKYSPFATDKRYRARENEYRYVEIVEGYGQEIDRALRQKLGDSYKDWMALRDEETVPDEGNI
jgi:hypothetical protein